MPSNNQKVLRTKYTRNLNYTSKQHVTGVLKPQKNKAGLVRTVTIIQFTQCHLQSFRDVNVL